MSRSAHTTWMRGGFASTSKPNAASTLRLESCLTRRREALLQGSSQYTYTVRWRTWIPSCSSRNDTTCLWSKTLVRLTGPPTTPEEKIAGRRRGRWARRLLSASILGKTWALAGRRGQLRLTIQRLRQRVACCATLAHRQNIPTKNSDTPPKSNNPTPTLFW